MSGSHDAATLTNISDNISISGIILCGLIISGLGVLNDVTITQSSAVWELWELAPETSARQLFTLRHADRPGPHRLHRLHHRVRLRRRGPARADPGHALRAAARDALTSAELSEEVIRTLVGSVGLVLAVPVTTLIAVLVVKATGIRGGAAAGPRRHGTAAAERGR